MLDAPRGSFVPGVGGFFCCWLGWGRSRMRRSTVQRALLDRLLHHAHVLKCGPRSWRTRVRTTLVESTGGA
ncbi:MAG: hypothetical protein F4018_11650 [Acidobacteria bacterium]|nr:hypothetical protein [Acidobacteriota bacterium]